MKIAKEPDFSNCKDPEFALAWWRYNQILLKQLKNNPFLKILKKTKVKK